MNITYSRDYIPPTAGTGVDSDLIYELNYCNGKKDYPRTYMDVQR